MTQHTRRPGNNAAPTKGTTPRLIGGGGQAPTHTSPASQRSRQQTRQHNAAANPDRIVEMKLASDHPLVQQLESLLGELIVLYEQLKSMSAMHLDAIRTADARKLAACVRTENDLIQQVAEIEKKRIRVVGQLADHLGSPSKQDTTIGWLTQRVDGPRAGEMRSAADRLRGLMTEVGKINAVARGAAEQLARHMDGLMGEITRGMNHAKVYSNTGRVAAGARVTSGLDLKS
jgi:hypothetical protein